MISMYHDLDMSSEAYAIKLFYHTFISVSSKPKVALVTAKKDQIGFVLSIIDGV